MPHIPGGTKRALQIGVSPGKPLVPPHENRVVLRWREMQGWHAWVDVRQLVVILLRTFVQA